MLELSDTELKITMINMLKDLPEKVGIIQEQMGNGNREIKVLRQVQKEMLEIKNTVAKINIDFHGLINRVSMAKKRLHEMCGKFLSWDTKRQKEMKIKTEYQELWDILKKCNTHTHTEAPTNL